MTTKHFCFLTGCIFFTFLKTFSATFIVNSNADSGAGTLREAITLANNNGSNEIDYIHFNIADISETGRTIILLSELPKLSSGLTIDASSQTGAFINISTAKIQLTLSTAVIQSEFIFFRLENISNITILALCFHQFDQPSYRPYTTGLLFRNANNIIVGAPGKGNFFSGISRPLSTPISNVLEGIDVLKVQSNIFGLRQTPFRLSGDINLYSCTNALIGGDDDSERNIFIGSVIRLYEPYRTYNGYFSYIKNNWFNYDGTRYYYNIDAGITLTGSSAPPEPENIKTIVQNNFIPTAGAISGLAFSQINSKLLAIGNNLGYNITKNTCISGVNVGAWGTPYFVLGGDAPEEENLITGDLHITDPRVQIIRNKIMGHINFNLYNENYPFINFLEYENNKIKGKSNPNARIQLYKYLCYSPSPCGRIKEYVTSVISDNNGNWSYDYTDETSVFTATATIQENGKDSATSTFAQPEYIYPVEANIIYPSCGKNNGSISNIKIARATHIQWFKNDDYGTVISTDTSLNGLSPGYYILHISNGINGCPITRRIELIDIPIPLHLNEQIFHITCGILNGRIAVRETSPYFIPTWLNSNMDSIGTGYYINNLSAGDYYYKLVNKHDPSCEKIYGPFRIENKSGPTLNLSNIEIINTTCESQNGSISNITINENTGQGYIEWRNDKNEIVGNNLNLLNKPAGKYRLKYKDESSCDTIFTPYYEILDQGKITLETENLIIEPTGCTIQKGSIREVRATGANSWYWTRIEDNTIVSNELEVQSQPAGTYQLTATNTFGCEKKSSIFTIPKANFANITVTAPSVTAAYCNHDNGSVKINGFSNNTAISSYEWVNSSNNLIGNNLSINNLSDGVYRLNVTDTNGCKETVYTATITKTPVPVISTPNLKTINDVCEQGTGSITGLNVTGLLGPTSYTWYNENNIITGNSLNLVNIPAGTYKLEVKDKELCTIYTSPIIVGNTNNGEAAPRYDDMVIQRNTPATLKVKNLRPGTYTLYSDLLGTQMIDRNETGIFQTSNLSIDQIYYIQYNKGVCLSALTPVKITVVDKSYFAIATGFTPNGDGHNEKLNLKVIGYINVDFFQIYNRNGEMVFSTKTIEDGWDGKWKGKEQLMGAYVWVARGRDLQGNIITDKGSFVLIR